MTGGLDEQTETPGGQPQENVEDRPGVSVVSPEDYPAADRQDSSPEEGNQSS